LRKKIFEFRQFLSAKVFPALGIGSIAKRKKVSYAYLQGQGLEIGALHFPLPVRKNVDVKYVDVISYEDAVEKFPELDPAKLVKPHYVDDGFTLSSIESGSQDFVVANHVLEHSPNPVGVILNWCRVLKPNGLIYFSVPIAEKCFDKGRKTTAVEHLFEDYALNEKGNTEEFLRRNKEHYKEWIEVSEPNLFRMRGENAPMLSKKEVEDRIELFSKDEIEIHFHTFTNESLALFVKNLERVIAGLKVLDVVQSKAELIVVLQKT